LNQNDYWKIPPSRISYCGFWSLNLNGIWNLKSGIDLMRAMILEKTAPVSTNPLREVKMEPPVPGPGEILIRVRACGVCRTDLHTVEGELALPRLPVVPGHQIVGEVAGAAPGASLYDEGDLVGAAWLNKTCGICRYCRSGKENLCESARFTGLNVNGGYAEMTTVPEAFAYAIPESFPQIQAAPLLCAGIIGFRALKLSSVKPGQRLGLYGFGASAHVTIQVARHWGCEVYVVSRAASHLSLAQELGAAWTGGSGELPPVKMDASIIFAPAGEIIPVALEALEKGGTLVNAGIYMSPVPSLDYEKHLFYEKVLRSVTANTREDGRELMELAASIPIRTAVKPYPLADANKALNDLAEDRMNGSGVLVMD
jgi:propanol-preferring alcohol dehydrogenase